MTVKIYDISQELFGSVVFPGDPVPQKEVLARMSDGSPYNLIALHMCAHNGTHVDAPSHFVADGKTIDQLDLEKVVGMAYVTEHRGVVTVSDAAEILKKAREADPESAKRILVKGKSELSFEAAAYFAGEGIWLYGNESQTVGPENAPMAVHQLLLGKEVILLEGIRLQDVPEGTYFLNAAPINLGGAEGSPCRAILVKMD